ncbi:MAG: zinc-ribbon domain-containing protein [Thermoanaerobaculia bacterium]|nr:zinc-ribbon domain-containing protein [Thermoanaerobaculia bacterium]
MVKITCSSCGKQLQIDETKLPMKEVKFPCPHCKTNQFYDRSKVAGEPAAEAAAVAPVVDDDDDDDYGKPKAILVGREVPALRDAVRSMGLVPLHFATAEEARDAYYRDHPRLVILCPQQMTPPPLVEIGGLTSVSPTDRRRGFYVLVADNLKTLDGNAAFLYGVNLVLATKDVGSFKKVYRDAHDFHEKLYEHFNTVKETK